MPWGGERGGEPNPPPENKPDAENREMALKSKTFNRDKNTQIENCHSEKDE